MWGSGEPPDEADVHLVSLLPLKSWGEHSHIANYKISVDWADIIEQGFNRNLMVWEPAGTSIVEYNRRRLIRSKNENIQNRIR